MSDITPFQFPATGQQVRAILIDGEPWFVAADVCAVLGIGNPSQAVSYLDADERLSTLISNEGSQNREVNIVSESGLYSLILRSRKPEAKAFKRWVTHDVLPTIRRTGSYTATAAVPDITTPQGQHAVAQMLLQSTAQNLKLAAKVAELEPDAARAQRTLNTHGLSLLRNVAKRFGIKEKTLREFMYGEKLLIRGGSSHNEPYAKHVQAGHFEVKTSIIEIHPDLPAQAKSTTYMTPKGEALIWKRLHEAGLVTTPAMPAPLAEQLQLGA